MKKIYVLLLVTVGTILSATAQPFEKGDKLLGGSISLANSKNTGNPPDLKATSFSISPSLGFFTKTNRLIGFSLIYQYGKSTSSNEQKSNIWGASVYKQYWNSLGKNFYFIIEGQVAGNYNQNKVTYSQNAYEKTNSISGNFSIEPGLAYRINKRFVLDIFFSDFVYARYSHYKSTNHILSQQQSIRKQNEFVVSTGFTNLTADNLQFGFRYLL